MHIDARTLENGTLIEGDICIAGAGPSGISIAIEFLNTGHKVILLEGGGFEYEDRIQELYNGKITGQPYYPMKSSELHYFGGSSAHWGGFCSLFDPIAFEKRDWVDKSGWPFKQDALLPYYERASVNLDLGVFDFDLKYWQKQDPSLVAFPFDEEVVWNKVWKFSPPTRFGKKYKESIVNAKNIFLYTYANLVDIRGNENLTNITEVTVKNYAGKTHRVRAKYFVIACAGIQNARILLASNKQAPNGLGNDNDLVGRYFMEHIELRDAELWLNKPSDLQLYKYKPPKIQGEIAIHPKKQAEYQILNGIISFYPLSVAKRMPPYIETWSSSDPIENQKRVDQAAYESTGGRIARFFNRFKAKNSNIFHQAFLMTLRMEQAPNPMSRITLNEEIDELGMPRPTLNWAFTPLEMKSVRKIFEIIGQQAGAAEIGRVKFGDELLSDLKTDRMPSSTSGGWHHMGTTRMSDDPKSGVTDGNCKIHGIDNIFMAGSSCFPTGAGVNPTYTLVALSIRLADHLKEKLKT